MAFHVCYDGGHFCDGFDVDTLDEGKQSCIEILTNWIEGFCVQHHISNPSEVLCDPSARDEWDSMIEECSVYVCDDNDPEWYSCYAPEGDQLTGIGWIFSDEMEVMKHE